MCIKLSPYFQNHEVYDSGTILLREIIDYDYQTLGEFPIMHIPCKSLSNNVACELPQVSREWHLKRDGRARPRVGGGGGRL